MNSLFLIFGMLGGMEWVLIFFAILLLFGGKKIPELMRGMGKGIREFNDAKNKVTTELEQGIKDTNEKEKTN
jgi:sec-independent protein translocase protein TatA